MSDRDELAELVHGGPLPTGNTVGELYALGCAYQRADAIIEAGWRPPEPSAPRTAMDDGEEPCERHDWLNDWPGLRCDECGLTTKELATYHLTR